MNTACSAAWESSQISGGHGFSRAVQKPPVFGLQPLRVLIQHGWPLLPDWCAVFSVWILLATPLSAQQPQRVNLIPRFLPGQVLRYQMEFRTDSEAQVAGAVENPQAPSHVENTVGAEVRLEVLTPDAAAQSCEGCVRVRFTYDKVTVATKADVPSPELAESEAQLKGLEGRSFEFTMAPDGKVRAVSGPGELSLSDKKTVEEWLVQLAGSGIPAGGVLPGEKWTAERPVPAPLRGVLWRSESTYLRDEPCRTQPAGEAPTSAEMCAVILVRFEITQREVGSDATPEEYRLRGLRTAGKLGGSGESLAYISLASGWVISVTQQATEETDLTVTGADDNSRVRYTGRIRRQSSMTLLPPSALKSP